MKKSLIFIPAITLAVMFASVGFFTGCTDGKGADATFDSLSVDKDTVGFADTVTVTIHMSGTETDKVSYDWSADEGEVIAEKDAQTAKWIAPETTGVFQIKCFYSLGVPHDAEELVNVTVIEE
jgi:hypothetical protein